ncbi:peptidyl-prolyl cis-trans isomerase [Brevibacillus sp. H7]|uniref:peptidyl-prolyl cis-trans isomerase n=1 Tax=Brevibacillus sp. H7 TaxID=3349138 RepID=UPI003816657C
MNNVKVLWSLIGALLLLLLVVTWSWYKEAGTLQAAAVVGEETISQADWIGSLKQKYGKQVLNDMINREVVFQEAKRLGITVDPKRVDEEVAKIQESYGSSTDSEFQTALQQQGGTDVEALRQEITYQLLLQELATRDVAVSDDELLAYYNNHLSQYAQPMQARVWQIVVASLAEAKQVHRELQNGANFTTLAKERSIDNLTAANGGDMGWVSFRDPHLADSLKETIASLGLNEDSNPVPLQQGQYAIIRVIDRKEAKQLSFDEVKDQIRRDLALAQVESLDVVLDRLKQSLGVQISGQSPN